MTPIGLGDLIAGRYRLREQLGGGGMGTVFRARDERGDRDVAIKILRAADANATRRLEREARATAGLDPARVAQVYEVGEAGGWPFLVMELVKGRTLRAMLGSGAVERGDALRILREIATTLAAAHDAGLVHRDVKPDNVMVQDDGRVVLLDFGIVKHLDPSEDYSQITTQLTVEGTMIGTPAYLAPEQALGRTVGPAVDQFALAVTAFELLTGRLPWSATDMTRLLAQLLAETPPPASTASSRVPQAFDAVLARALSKTPEPRFPTIMAFVDALDAAERGETTTSPESRTLAGSAASEASAVAPPVVPPPSRRSRRTVAVLAAITALAGGFFLVRGRAHVAPADPPRPHAPPALVVTSERPLACPVFQVDGVPETGPRLGAAAASLACTRAAWYLGGSDDKVLVPAGLLDAPTRPEKEIPDPFATPDVRARTLEIARTRGLPSLDGTVSRARDGWRVELVVRAPDGAEIARTVGSEAPYFELAIKRAVIALWHTAPLAPATIDPDVARWTGNPDIEAGLLELDLTQVGSSEEVCATVRSRGASLGSSYFGLNIACGGGPTADASASPFDESSAPALVVSVARRTFFQGDASTGDTRRIALKLESMRASQTSRLGRASISHAASILWASLHEPERAYATELSALGDDPLLFSAWHGLGSSADQIGSYDACSSVASVWFPQEPVFLKYSMMRKSQSDNLELNLRDGRLAYVLEPTVNRTLFLGRALAEAGRPEEVRALTVATPVDAPAPDPNCTADLLAAIDLHDARFGRALSRLQAAGETGTQALPVVAAVLGRTDETATRWAGPFVHGPEDAATRTLVWIDSAVIALCMSAGGALAGPCLSRVERLAQYNWWGAGGDLFLRGAKRYAVGDVRGAVATWRPIVGTGNDQVVRLLPTEAFERAGEPDLAARIDARKMLYRQFAGISDATPREARRAFERGDRARATELATSVVRAWEVADVTIPAVAEMRALLVKIGR